MSGSTNSSGVYDTNAHDLVYLHILEMMPQQTPVSCVHAGVKPLMYCMTFGVAVVQHLGRLLIDSGSWADTHAG